jgi:hypothetical protein
VDEAATGKLTNSRSAKSILAVSDRAFFRIVQTNPPTGDDFIANAAHGKPPPREDDETARLWRGISTYGSLKRARERAISFPWLGRYIAELRIADNSAIVWERTTASRDHFTLGGPHDTLLALVVAVHPIVAIINE